MVYNVKAITIRKKAEDSPAHDTVNQLPRRALSGRAGASNKQWSGIILLLGQTLCDIDNTFDIMV